MSEQENQITIECQCINCGVRGTNKLYSLDDEYITFICPKCGVMNSIPRDSVYLAKFEPIGMSHASPTASIEITPTVTPTPNLPDPTGIKYPKSPPVSACSSSESKESDR